NKHAIRMQILRDHGRGGVESQPEVEALVLVCPAGPGAAPAGGLRRRLGLHQPEGKRSPTRGHGAYEPPGVAYLDGPANFDPAEIIRPLGHRAAAPRLYRPLARRYSLGSASRRMRSTIWLASSSVIGMRSFVRSPRSAA